MYSFFFPTITRRKVYNGNGVGTSRYTDYYAEIEHDCKNRCVYCDATLGEIGYEGMQLDHFRPQKHFPTLVHDPRNLVLGCGKCNRSKWYHWPSTKSTGAPSHDGNVGFIDPFLENRKAFFRVKSDGEIEPLQGPASYMVQLLKLNRKGRMQVRRMRIIKDECMLLARKCRERSENLLNLYNKGQITADEAMKEIERLEAHKVKLLVLQERALKL